MKLELTEIMWKDFPNLYRHRTRAHGHYGKNEQGNPLPTSLMYYGFSHGNGWFDLIYKLSRKLEDIILELPEGEKEKVFAVQCKEKFGTLRFYMSEYNKLINAAIDEAETASAITCEECGKSGTLQGDTWVRTTCDPCEKTRRELREKENEEYKNKVNLKT